MATLAAVAPEPSESQLTCNGESDQEADTQDHKEHIQDEVLVVIDSNTVVDPRAMAITGQSCSVLSNTSTLTGLLWPHISRIVGNACFVVVCVSYMLYKSVFH